MKDFSKLSNELTKAGFPNQNVDTTALSLPYVELVSRMCENIRLLLSTDEKVNFIKDLSNIPEWKVELSSFLSEIQCPYRKFYEGPLESRLLSLEDRVLLLDYLLEEVLTARMSAYSSDEECSSPTAANLKCFVKVLNLGMPPQTVTIVQFFKHILGAIQAIPDDLRNKLIGQPLLKGKRLSSQQWKILSKVSEVMELDFNIRRSVLAKRLDATFQSFIWSDKLSSDDEINAELHMEAFRKWHFSQKIIVGAADVLAARDSLAVVAKISSEPPATRSSNPLTKVKVGHVPDRGGRPSELAPPPPEMPSWQQRQGQAHNAQQFQGGGRGQNPQQNYQKQQRGDFQQQPGGYIQPQGEFQHQDSQQGSQNDGRRPGGKGQNRNRGVQGGGWKKDRQHY